MSPADPVAVALTMAGILDDLGIRHTTGSSIASSIAGEPRSTVDIDIIADIDEPRVAALVSALSSSF